MNKVLRLDQSKGKVFFTSDWHWNHNPKWPVPLWEKRGYKSVQESNEHIIQQVNAIVGPDDILFNLGDLTLNCVEEQFDNFIRRLTCQNIYTLWGNHNSPAWQIYQREVKYLYGPNSGDPWQEMEVYPFRYKNMVFIGNYAEITVDGLYFVLSHYPLYVFNHMSHGSMMLCGHSHGNLPLSRPTDSQSKILDCGWDLHKKPLSIKEIIDIMAKKQVLKVDHHGED